MSIYNDGAVQMGARDLTINSVVYAGDSVAVNRPTKNVRRTNSVDEPSGSRIWNDFVTGSATLQLADETTPIPLLGMTFEETFVASIGAETFIIDNVGQPEEKAGEKKVSITFVKKYSA